MNPIIEKVARATHHVESEPHKAETGYGDIYGWDDVMPQVQDRHRAIARAAIKATLEHLRDNVSDGVGVAGGLKLENVMFEGGDGECTGVIFQDVKPVFKAMIKQAISELDA